MWNKCAMLDQQVIVEKLREKQRELGVRTQAELAQMLGVTEATVSRLYSGKREPGAVVIMAMLRLWPDVFSGDGGSGERHTAGDECDGGADHGHPGDLDAVGAVGDPCAHRTVG